MSKDLVFHKVGNDFYEKLSPFGKEQMDKYLPNHHEIQSLHFKNLIENEMLKKYFNTLISYLYKGSEKVEQDFRLTNFKQGSIMSKIVKHYSLKELLKKKINVHVISYFIMKDLVELFKEGKPKKSNLILSSHSRVINKKKYFLSSGFQIVEEGIIAEIYRLKILLKYNNFGFVGYEKENLVINYGEINKFYKKSKSLNKEEKEKILVEIEEIIKFSKRKHVTCG